MLPFRLQSLLAPVGLLSAVLAGWMLIQPTPSERVEPVVSSERIESGATVQALPQSALIVTSGMGQLKLKPIGSSDRLSSEGNRRPGEGALLGPSETRLHVFPHTLSTGTELTTGNASVANLESKDQSTRLRLLSNTRIEVLPAKDGSSVTRVVLLSGEIESINQAESSVVIVEYEGQRLSLKNRYPKRNLVKAQLTDSPLELAQGGAPDLVQEDHSLVGSVASGSAPAARFGSTGRTDPNTGSGSQESGRVGPAARTGSSGNTVTRLDGEPTNDSIRAQLKAQAGGIQKCYVSMVNRLAEKGQAAAGLPSGELRVGFQIQPSGKVTQSRIQSTPFTDVTFNRCVTDSLSRVRFKSFASQNAIDIESLPILVE